MLLLYPILLLLVLCSNTSNVHAQSITSKASRIEGVIAPLFQGKCIPNLLDASRDTIDALHFIRAIEKVSSYKFELLDVGYTLIIPNRHGSWTLWIQLDSIGIKHITESWYYNDIRKLDHDYQSIFNTMLGFYGEPNEDNWDYAYWDPIHLRCGDIMLLREQNQEHNFICRRITFR